ncbi:MAG TPA: hypothetical protein VFF37_08270 [Streptomyces sp.]|nr:hypothetical protein [Streptomyces sp.]
MIRPCALTYDVCALAGPSVLGARDRLGRPGLVVRVCLVVRV